MESEFDIHVSIEVEIENKIKLIEKNMIYLKNNKMIKRIKSEKFTNDYKNFKYAINALMDEPSYFKIIRELVVNENNNSNTDIEIFNSDHFDTISRYKKFGKKMIKIFKFAQKLDFITNFEYRILKKISKHVKNIWKTDEIFEDIYKDKIFVIPTFKEIEFYFSISDIILAKIKDSNIQKNNQIEIIDDEYYMELINKLKNNLVKKNTNQNQDNENEW
jgi:hypothetical protein